MMSAFECFKEYMALKNHFTRPSYDYFKYNGKTKVSFDSFESRKDKLFFMKMAKHQDAKNYMLANLVENEKLWIKDIAYSQEAENVYQNWLKRKQSLTYIFQNESSKLNDDFNSNFKIMDGSHPFVLKLYLRKEISLETLIILVDTVSCMSYWNKKMEYDPVWSDMSTKIIKYRPFIDYDREKIKKILLDKFDE